MEDTAAILEQILDTQSKIISGLEHQEKAINALQKQVAAQEKRLGWHANYIDKLCDAAIAVVAANRLAEPDDDADAADADAEFEALLADDGAVSAVASACSTAGSVAASSTADAAASSVAASSVAAAVTDVQSNKRPRKVLRSAG